MAFEIYKKEYQPNLSAQGFKDKLVAWCRYMGYELNPEAAKTTSDKRIMCYAPKLELSRGVWTNTGKREAVECFYIRTDSDKAINSRINENDNPI